MSDYRKRQKVWVYTAQPVGWVKGRVVRAGDPALIRLSNGKVVTADAYGLQVVPR